LAFAGAVEDYPFGEDLLTVKVAGKVFAWIPLDEADRLGHSPPMAVKLPAGLVTELQHAYLGQVRPARPLDQRFWVTIPLGAAIPDSEARELSPCPTARSWRGCPGAAAPLITPATPGDLAPQPDRPATPGTDPEPETSAPHAGHPCPR